LKRIIFNGKVVLPDRTIEKGCVSIANGHISSVFDGEPNEELRSGWIDAKGGWITPGLTDIHTHGNGGYWGFFGADEILNMARAFVKIGVTSFLPATVSLPHNMVLCAIDAIKIAMSKQSGGTDYDRIHEKPAADGARVLGINLEGPFINPKRAGAHNPLAIREPQGKEVDEIIERAGSALRLLTVAPEIKGGMELIDRLVSSGILPSIGHSDATAEQTHEAIARGATHFTHLFNAVRVFHQREPGCAFAALIDPNINVELILDGKHVHIDVAKIAYKIKTAQKMILVSDSIHAAGMPDGDYNVWGFQVKVKDGICSLPDGTFAGSVLTLNTAVKNAIDYLGASPSDAFRMASINGLKELKYDDKLGSIEPGKIADIAVFDNEFNCISTLISGEIAYKS
jgi:N-acetylglucosamine-6-phosphate deacetylase